MAQRTEELTLSKFKEITQLVYKEQAIWFLNGFWNEVKGDAELLWSWEKHFVELDKMSDKKLGEKGNELDAFWSAKFIEDMDKAITAKQRKEALREIDQDNNGHMALIEYLLWKYKKTLGGIVNAPQGDNKEEIERIQKQMEEVKRALNDVLAKLEAQKQALKQTQAARAENEKKLAAQKIAVQESTAAVMKVKKELQTLEVAEAELKAAVDALKAEEEAYAAKIKAFEDIIATQTGMKQAKAKNELAQLKSEDPLPLRRAKITAEAALRKAEKQRKVAEAAKVAAEAKKAALEEAERALERTAAELAEKEKALAAAVQELEAAYVELEQKMTETQAAMEEAKKSGGVAHGALWWAERQLYEADGYLPTSKMKYDHSKPFEYKEQ